MEQNTFKGSLAAVDKWSPISGFIMWHSKLLQKINNICAVNQIFFFKEKMKELLMPVAIKSDACAIGQEVFSFNLDAKSSAGDFDKLRSRTRSLSPFWEKNVKYHR